MDNKMNKLVGRRLDSTDTEHRPKDDGENGRIIENMLGIEENNSTGADCVDGEIKSVNTKSTCRTTLFSCEPIRNKDRGYNRMTDIIDAYATFTDGDFKKCNTTFRSGKPNNKGLYLSLERDEERLCIYGINDELVGHWQLEKLWKRFSKKLNKVVLFEHDGSVVSSVTSHSGIVKESVWRMIENGDIVVEFRAKTGKNRGTSFRAYKKSHSKMYKGANND